MWLPMIAVVAKALPRNAAVAEQLELLSDILELEGEAAYRLLAYRRAAALVREQSGLVAELALEGKAKDLPGIGKTIEGKIVEIVNESEIRALTKHKALVPPDVVKFTQLPGLGPKTARKIWQELGVTTLTDLKAAAKAERLRLLPGIGAKLEERRRKETFRDLDIIATATEPGELTEYFTKLRWVEKVAARGESKATVVSNDGLRFDLRVVPSGLYGNLLQHFTGSKHHNVALREDAVRRGLSISENGVKDVESGEVFKTGSEQEVYEFLGYQYIPPELRENLGELEAARNGELPALVELGDLRGDLHAHSSWSSDGKNTIEEMAAVAKSRGYSYLAVTDHSHYLREGRLEAQDREIEALNERLGRFRLLKGIEVNIRADGTLDVDDETLARRDWVVASLHTAFDKNPTERVVAAMENPHVDCIGHLTARKINRRGPADIDLGRVFETALATNTFLEI
ncbi:MAG: PHP domain-containing protein, partial [Actinobacteria bacterium]